MVEFQMKQGNLLKTNIMSAVIIALGFCFVLVLVYYMKDEKEEKTLEYNSMRGLEEIRCQIENDLKGLKKEEIAEFLNHYQVESSVHIFLIVPQEENESLLSEEWTWLDEMRMEKIKQQEIDIYQNQNGEKSQYYLIQYLPHVESYLVIQKELLRTEGIWKSEMVIYMVIAGVIALVILLTSFIFWNYHRQLLELSQKDPLTGLYNKKATEEKITKILKKEKKKRGLYGFFIIDIDNFKQFNDSMGHIFGDEVLYRISKKFQEYFKKTDVVGRIGGDEFVAFLKIGGEEKELMQKAKELSEQVCAICLNEDKDARISISMGIARFTADGEDFETLYKKADDALYHSKDNGKGCCYLYQEEMKRD